MPGKLEFLVQADGAFFALARIDDPANAADIRLSFDDAAGAECGAVPGIVKPGMDGGTAVFCGDSTLLARASGYRLGSFPRQSLHALGQHAIAQSKAWKPLSRPLQRLYVRVLAYVRRAHFLVASGQYRELWDALRSKLGLSSAPVRRPPVAQMDDLQSWLQDRVLAQERLVLMVDHGLGGGATHYCRKLLASHLQAGAAVLLITSEPSSGTYVMQLYTANAVEERRSTGLSELLHVPRWPNLTGIVYNTAALFVHPLAVVALMLRLQQRSGARLTVLFHDYFPVCPSIFLIGPQGRYCGVPDAATCRRCMPQNPGLPELLLHYRHYDPILWRQVWECLLLVAHETTAFSQPSADIARKVWPWLDASRLQVVPHQAEPLDAVPVTVRNTQNLHIGIVGQIGPHKGIDVIAAIARVIRRRRLNVRISVIGTVEARVDRRVVSQTGYFERQDLPRLIAESGANVMLFPSVWPETFSYVVQELMALQLPVACFDMGAPAERVRTYDKGLILDDEDADGTLDQLIAFYKRLYPAS